MTRTRLFFAALPLALMVGACAAETEEESGESADELKSKPTYAGVSSIIDTTCGGCHSAFTTLAGIKPMRTDMISKISSGKMPLNGPAGWNKTADGKKVLAWLKTGADVK
jgi:hypothetical protein